MSPSLLQLQALGSEDVYLTKDPQINIFKYNYYRYVNFATETVKLETNIVSNFGKKMTCEISRRGHLLSKLHLHIKLPQLVKKDGSYACWSDTIGYSIFSEPIELMIGGIVVDRLYPQFLNAWDELTTSDKRLGKNLMLLKSDVYSANFDNATKPYDLIIPLDFWFTKDYNLALPLLSMHHQSIKINFRLRPFEECINYDGTLEPDYVPIVTSSIYAEYVYLDEVILQQFKSQKHTYLIQQVQYNEDEVIPAGTSFYNTRIKLTNPCKELVFFAVEKPNIANNNHFVYSKSVDDSPLILAASLLLDGKLRFDNLPEFYYRVIFPQNIHSVIPLKYIYTMPFSIRPEDNQPTGSLNLSRFNDITLALTTADTVEMNLYVFGISYNIVTVENGMLTMEFLI
jgi:hypothetical protein